MDHFFIEEIQVLNAGSDLRTLVFFETPYEAEALIQHSFDVKTNARQNSPCLLNFHLSANQFKEKRFSQTSRLAIWLSNEILKMIYTYIFLESEA